MLHHGRYGLKCCPALMQDAKLGSLFSLLGFPIAFGVELALKVHNGDSALAHATEMHDMDDILYDEDALSVSLHELTFSRTV